MESYLAAWNIRDASAREEAVARILEAAGRRARMASAPVEMAAALDESDQYLRLRFQKTAGASPAGETLLSVDSRAALLLAGGSEFDDAVAACSAGHAAPQRCLAPQRPLETLPMTMRTSLSHIPSFRLIAGWSAIVAGLILAFIFTH